MKNRSPVAVALLGIFVPFYMLYWYISTASEMRANGASLPTSWLLIVPLVNIWWVYQYSQSVEKVTNGKTSGMLAFLALWLIGAIGAAIIQDSFNGVGSASSPVSAAPAASPMASMPPSDPTNPPASPVAPATAAMPAAPMAPASPAMPEQPTTPPTTPQPPAGPVGS